MALPWASFVTFWASRCWQLCLSQVRALVGFSEALLGTALPVTSSNWLLGSQPFYFWQCASKTLCLLEPIILPGNFRVELIMAPGQLSLLFGPHLVQEKLLGNFGPTTQWLSFTFPPKLCTSHSLTLSVSSPRVGYQSTDYCPYSRGPADFLLVVSSLTLHYRAGPQEKLDHRSS